MNKSNNKNLNSKLPEIISIFLVVAAAGYYFYSSSSGNSSSSSFTVSDATSTVGGNVLILLNQIHSLKIDTSFFQSPVYQSLTDFTVPIPTENIGKSDPFLPPGTGVEVSPTSTGSSSISDSALISGLSAPASSTSSKTSTSVSSKK